VHEAKRTYGFLLVFGQFAVAAAGYVGGIASNIRKQMAPGEDAWQVTLNCLIWIVAVTSCISVFLYHWVYRYVLTDKRFYDKPELPGVKLKSENKARLRDGLRLICRSPYLLLLTVLVFSYAFTDNMLENFWKHEVSRCYPDPNDYCAFMSRYTTAYGILSIVFTLFVTAVFRKCSWKIGALVTPMVMLIGGFVLFGGILIRRYVLTTPEKWYMLSQSIVQYGLVVMVLGRSGKMSFFDMSKEIAFIPLSNDLKVKGKVFADGMGHRFGKSFGSGFQVLTLTLISTFTGMPAVYDQVVPYAFAVYLFLVIAWVISVFRLSRRIEDENIADD
jgi:AAA family ATP:ADP antiporter